MLLLNEKHTVGSRPATLAFPDRARVAAWVGVRVRGCPEPRARGGPATLLRARLQREPILTVGMGVGREVLPRPWVWCVRPQQGLIRS